MAPKRRAQSEDETPAAQIPKKRASSPFVRPSRSRNQSPGRVAERSFAAMSVGDTDPSGSRDTVRGQKRRVQSQDETPDARIQKKRAGPSGSRDVLYKDQGVTNDTIRAEKDGPRLISLSLTHPRLIWLQTDAEAVLQEDSSKSRSRVGSEAEVFCQEDSSKNGYLRAQLR